MDPENAAHQENRALLRLFGEHTEVILGFMERQLNALHMRAQIVIGFAVVTFTTTGFAVYGIAIAIMLLNPAPIDVPVR